MKATKRLRAPFLLFVVFAVVSVVNCDRTGNEDRYLKIPALGRTAHLGHLYNEVLDEFRDVSVFSQKIPQEFITTAIKPKLTTISGPANTFHEKFKLLNIQETVAANILSGFTELEGSARFLNDDNFQRSTLNEFSGALIKKYQTVKESLEVYYSNLTRLYNSATLNDKEATHVVTGIEWGADTVVRFKSTPHGSQLALQEQMEQFRRPQQQWHDSNAIFSMSIMSDVSVPFESSENLTQVYNLLRQIPQELKTINDEKGISTKYVLTPLSVIKRFILPNSEPSNSANEINTWILKEIISYFDEIASYERQTNSLYKTLHSQANCLLEDTKTEIEKMQASTQTLKANLTSHFYEALKEDRMASGPHEALLKLSQEFSSNQFNVKRLKEQLSEFNSDVKRTEFCARLEAYTHIKYVGLEQNLDLEISQHFNQSVYVLFTKAEFTKNNLKEWQKNLYTLFNELNQPGNKRYIVDCDFRQPMCNNVSESVIHLYINGRLLSPKVERVYAEEVDELKLQISQLNSTLATVSEYAAAFTAQLSTVKEEVIRNRNDINAQRTGLEMVNNTAIQNKNKLNSKPSICEAQTAAFALNATSSASFGCGGTIQLPSKGESILLDFNLAPTDGTSQRCLWTLDATQNNKVVLFKVKLTLLCKHQSQIAENTLTFTEWHSASTYKDITTSMISSSYQDSFLLSQHYDNRGFLSFNSKTMKPEAGFILRVDVLDTTVLTDSSSSSATHAKSVGNASYSFPSKAYGMSSIAINPQPAANVTLTVDVDSSGKSNSCIFYDSVDILEFGMDGVPRKLGRLCGQQSGISYKTENPVAALFNWYGGQSGRGVKLSWK